MARRASSGVNSQALLIGGLVLLLVLGGGYWFMNRDSGGFDAPALDLARDIDAQRSLAGNKYSVTGILDSRAPGGGMATLKIDDHFLAIKIPADFKSGNLNLQDEYTFLVEFNNAGLAVALDVK